MRKSVPGCPGTFVEDMPSFLHGLQTLKVMVDSGGKIPLHAHGCATTMFVRSGSARKLTADGPDVIVKAGDFVSKRAHEHHGFDEIGPEGFEFLSLSEGEGIIGPGGRLDMQFV